MLKSVEELDCRLSLPPWHWLCRMWCGHRKEECRTLPVSWPCLGSRTIVVCGHLPACHARAKALWLSTSCSPALLDVLPGTQGLPGVFPPLPQDSQQVLQRASLLPPGMSQPRLGWGQDQVQWLHHPGVQEPLASQKLDVEARKIQEKTVSSASAISSFSLV